MRPSEALAQHRGAIRHELSALLGIPVDVVTPGALPDAVRKRVLEECRPL